VTVNSPNGAARRAGSGQPTVAKVEARYSVDPRRVFFLGWSNGGFMAHRMGCEAADLVAAFVAVSGDVWNDPALCMPTSAARAP